MKSNDAVGILTPLKRCEDEIIAALTESRKQHTRMEQLGILMWELDWRSEREFILLESTRSNREQDETAG
jgi:hypothetical protein